MKKIKFTFVPLSCILHKKQNMPRKEQCGFTPFEIRILPRANNKALRGFTFIELLVSITIFTLVAIAVYSVFANGVGAWKRGNENKNYERRIRLTSEKIAKDLRNSFKLSNVAFEGTDEFVMFPALILCAADSAGDTDESHYEVGRVAYFYDPEKDALCKEEKTYALVSGEEPQTGKVVIENVRRFELSYCYLDNATGTYKWKDDWEKEEQDTIPQAIKIKMAFKRKTNQDDFEKTIFIPIGTGEQKMNLGQ